MSNLTQFFGGGAGGIFPKQKQFGGVANQIQSTTITGVAIGQQAMVVTSGVSVANVLKTVLSVTGKGALTLLGFASADAAIRSHRIRVTLDGNIVFDTASIEAAHAADRFFLLHGGFSGSVSIMPVCEGVPLLYDQSILIEYASSLTETDKAKIAYINYLR